MTKETVLVLRANKYANIIVCMCELFGLTLREATDIFYSSDTFGLIEEGIADLQCRSDKYLATLVWEEYKGA